MATQQRNGGVMYLTEGALPQAALQQLRNATPERGARFCVAGTIRPEMKVGKMCAQQKWQTGRGSRGAGSKCTPCRATDKVKVHR
jgi:hypothetical protein